MSSRHLSRTAALQALYAADLTGELSIARLEVARGENTQSFEQDEDDAQFTSALLKGIAAKQGEIDAVIERAAPEWPIAKIAIIDRNILRLGLFELLFVGEDGVPPKVALNEAIELAKTFGGESSGRFVNGVLGSVYRDLGSPRRDEKPKVNEKEYFAGIVVCARDGAHVFVALIKDPFDHWTLPKTRYQKGELSDEAALRAAREDLGLESVTLRAPLGEHEYEAHDPDTSFVTRRVAYYVATAKRAPLHSVAGTSAREAAWFSEHELADLEIYNDLKGIIESGLTAARIAPH